MTMPTLAHFLAQKDQAGVKTADEFRQAIAEAEDNNEVTSQTVDTFIELLKSAKAQVIPKSRIDVTRLFAEHLGLKESAPLHYCKASLKKQKLAQVL